MPREGITAPPIVEPVVPTLYPAPFDDPAWLFEPKCDGFRGCGGAGRLWARSWARSL